VQTVVAKVFVKGESSGVWVRGVHIQAKSKLNVGQLNIQCIS